jgi:uncharacterized membrane protein
MGKGRVEAFSDGVFAIIITIMVLELRVPHEPTFQALWEIWPIFLSYVLSFFFVGVYWNNHHHLLHTVVHMNSRIMWANLHLLFWLSLVPFATNWLGETYPSASPTLLYGVIMFMCGVAYAILQRAIGSQQTSAQLRNAHRSHNRKTYAAMVLLAGALFFAWIGWVLVAIILFACVAFAYVVPDRRFETAD